MSGREQSLAVVILAAGMGTRMKSSLPKVLHTLAGRPMLDHVLDTVSGLPKLDRIVLITSDDSEEVSHCARAHVAKTGIDLQTITQIERLGTGHAVQTALPGLEGFKGTVLVTLGDVPLITTKTLASIAAHVDVTKNVHVSVLGFYANDPAEYGRMVVTSSGELEAIVEYKDASDNERSITLCNSGVMAISSEHIEQYLGRISNQNAKKEYYLTDVVSIARSAGHHCNATIGSEEEVIGVNSREQLAEAEAILQKRLRKKAMDQGVTMIDPDSVFLSTDTCFGQDVVIQPSVFFGPGVRVGNQVIIKAYSHLEGCSIGDRDIIGPFARLRPGTVLDEEVHIGNFVEIKNAHLAPKTKANHLAYIGDAQIGRKVNIGAGTITCNYDGYNKYRTVIEDECFIGSNTSLVAPVTIGKGAIIGAGSTITKSVEQDALSVARASQSNLPDKGRSFRIAKEHNKKKK